MNLSTHQGRLFIDTLRSYNVSDVVISVIASVRWYSTIGTLRIFFVMYLLLINSLFQVFESTNL